MKKLEDPKDAEHITQYLSMQNKEAIWNSKNFIENMTNPELLTLKELNFNFMHDLFI